MSLDYLKRPLVILFFLYVFLIILFKPFLIKKPSLINYDNSFLCGNIISYPQKRGDKFSFIIKNDNSSYIINSSSADFSLYDYVCVLGKTKEIDFFYSDYFNRKNIFYEVDSNEIKIVKESNFIFKLSAKIRKKVKDALFRSFDYETYSVIAGIFLGEKEELNWNLKKAIINTGVMHLLVASGSNISYIVLLIANFFWFLRRGSILLQIISIIFAFIYSVMIGLDPPITRAFIMLLLVFIRDILERNTDIIQILFLSAFVMLIINPILIFDISFLMSFLSVYGIVIGWENFGRFIYIKKDSFTKNKSIFFQKIALVFVYISNSIISLVVITFFAQLSLIPVLLKFFYKISIVSFVSNIILIPLSFVIMISTIIFILLKSFFNISFLLSNFLSFCGKLFIKICYFFSSFKYSSVYIFYPNEVSFVFSVIIIFLFLNFSLLKEIYLMRSFFAISLLIFFISINWVKKIDGVFSFSSKNVNGYLILRNGKSYLINPVIFPDKIYSFLFSHNYSKIDFIFVGSFKGYRKKIVDEISSRFNSKVYLPIWFGNGDGIFGGDKIEIFDIRFDDKFGYFNRYSQLIFCDESVCYK
jgi:competence protein ComEC